MDRVLVLQSGQTSESQMPQHINLLISLLEDRETCCNVGYNSIQMGCTENQSRHKEICESNLRLLPIEIEYLQMMYQDLAMRSKTRKLTRENFDIFFHLSGLWGKEMFERFKNKSVEATINQQEFISSIDLMVKGTFAEKCDFLFKIYDINGTGGVSYNEFLKMLYSYPKEELKEMLTDENFLKSLNSYQLMFFFGPAKELQDKTIQEDGQEDENGEKNPKTEYTQSEFMEIESPLRQKRKPNKSQQHYSIAVLPTHVLSKVKITNNITSLVKRYATYIFKKLKLDKNTQEINPKQFKTLVQKQQKIFNVYLEGFHTYIWWVDIEQGQPVAQHQKMTPWIEDECLEIEHPANNYNERVQSHRYLRFIRTTIFVYKKKGRKCIQIRNMEGLYVQEAINVAKLRNPPNNRRDITDFDKLQSGLIDEEFSYGILIKHHDGIYPEKEYFFRDRKTQKEWMRYLSEFRYNSIYNEYQILEKIGEGNYSSVYRGMTVQRDLKGSSASSANGEHEPNNRNATEDTVKENGPPRSLKTHKVKKQVAIKVIQKFKLSHAENEVIKFECGILELCHHPNIVQFEKQYNTKTRMYIVTEYLGEGDLFDYVKRNSFLEEYEAATVMKQLFEVINYLNYELGLIHRDLKPENVLITTKLQEPSYSNLTETKTSSISRIKLIDFGFAVYKDNLKSMSEKQKFAGSPGYIAPEIFERKNFDEGIDMFSLGIIMYFMLSGQLPFHSPIFENIVELTVQCNVCLSNVHWMNVSDEAKNLLQSILTFQEERINVKQALKHPWLQDVDALKKHIGKNKKNRYTD